MEMTLRDDVIVIAPVKRGRGRHSLEELESRISEGCRAEETAWVSSAGQERHPADHCSGISHSAPGGGDCSNSLLIQRATETGAPGLR